MYNLNPNCIITDRGDMYIIVNTELSKYYQINKSQFDYLQKCIGKETINTPEDIENPKERAFIIQLIHIGVLVNTDQLAHPRKRFEYTDLLHFRIAILNPDHFCTWLLKRIKLIWRWYILLPVAILLIVSLWGTVLAWRSSPSINQNYSIVQLLLLIYATTVILSPGHELAHAIVCKAYGGTVQDMGVAFINLNPCVYCNISASYLFKKKKQRIMVALVGILYDIVAVAISIIVLFNFFKLNKKLLGDYCYFSILMLLFELNPLIKHDGYYVLTEITAVYNLREKAFELVHSILTKPTQIIIVIKENHLYILYGIISVLYTVFHLIFLIKSLIAILMFMLI